MQRRTIITTTTALAAVLGIGIAGVAVATEGDDNEAPITGDALVHASEAALAHTGEGRVTETEVGDEESYYEIEVTLDSGDQIDVQLDAEFQVVSSSADVEDDE